MPAALGSPGEPPGSGATASRQLSLQSTASLESSDSEEPSQRVPTSRRSTSRLPSRIVELLDQGWESKAKNLIGRCFCRRSAARRQNAWVKLGSRSNRQVKLRNKYARVLSQLRYRWHMEAVPQWIRLWRSCRYFMGALWTGTTEFIRNLLGAIDAQTGLPARILEKYLFIELVHEGPHGYLFKAVRATRSEALFPTQQALPQQGAPLVAIRVRDKSQGHVLQLGLSKARSLLQWKVLQTHRCSCKALHQCKRGIFLESGFHHGAVVEHFEVFETSELYVEVMEYLGGGNLNEYIEASTKQVDEFSACKIMTRVFMALRYLHKRNLMHRDVRSTQILLPEKDDLGGGKLGDLWCLARIPKRGALIDRDRPVNYLTTAPEVLLSGAWSEKADVWSAGCVLFELLYGHPPFGGEGSALAHRVCHCEPEFDVVCGAASASAVELLRMLLARNPAHRPTANAAMSHPWFQEHDAPQQQGEAVHRRSGHLIKRVRLVGTPPACRTGMPASNLLGGQAGMLNGGYATYVGMSSCQIDFEVGGEAAEQEYWVTAVVVALWGGSQNPRTIMLQNAVRPEAPFIDIVKHEVVEHSTEARLEPDRPMRHVRILFQRNFGSPNGIALRKASFYGYRARSIPIVMDLGKCTCERGAFIYTHASQLEKATLEHKVHHTLHRDLKTGAKIQGKDDCYLKLCDICSGTPHHSSHVVGSVLELQPGLTLTAAILGLRYMSMGPVGAAQPRMRVQVVREAGDGGSERTPLFLTEDLDAPEWDLTHILQNGYTDYPALFSKGLEFSTDNRLRIELLFENNAGLVHIPAMFGLIFYYIPMEGHTGSSKQVQGASTERSNSTSSSREKHEHEAAGGSSGPAEEQWDQFQPPPDTGADAGEPPEASPPSGTGDHKPEGSAMLWPPLQEGHMSSASTLEGGAQEHEASGCGESLSEEGDGWTSGDRSHRDTHGTGSSTPREQEFSDSETAAADAGHHNHRTTRSRPKRQTVGTAAYNADQKEKALTRESARQQAVKRVHAMQKEALEAARARADARKRAEEARGVQLPGGRGLGLLPADTGFCSDIAAPLPLAACARSLTDHVGAGPLALCGFTPSPPPPSPRV